MGGKKAGKLRIDPDDSPVFAESWHARALAVTVATGAIGAWNLDASRHSREKLPPADYRRFSYYEKWLAGLSNLLVEHGLVTLDELRARKADTKKKGLDERALKGSQAAGALAKGGSTLRTDITPPLFTEGEIVTTISSNLRARVFMGHTRLPEYACNKTGLIIRHHGSHVLPDSNAHFLGEAAEHLYGVMFKAGALWADALYPQDEICLDLWESYLVPSGKA